ncbi:MAG: hypothetical protein ABJB34_05375, partial [Acidobacteriota bacterium]
AFPANTPPRLKHSEKTFADRIIFYRDESTSRSRNLNAAVHSTADDIDTPKPKKSLVAKLQYVYKKPWDVIKAVGSKLR